MSLYNMINGLNLCTFFLIPMLGDKHPDHYPRFRDCFMQDDERPEYNDHIHVYTRVGGNNRGQDYGEEELMKHPNFVATFDDEFDNTYASYVFSVPEEWKADFELIKEVRIKEVSVPLQNRVRMVFPKLKEQLDQLWSNQDAAS